VRVALLSRAVHPLHEPGGLERAVYHLARHLQAQGIETVLLTRPPTREGSFPGEVVTVPYGGRPASHGRVFDRSLHYPRFADRLGERAAAFVREGRVDVVHAQGLTALGYGRRRRSEPSLRAPLLMNPQGMEEHKTTGLKRLALGRLRALSRRAARLADRVIATDEATRSEVEHLLGVPESRVVVLPNGIDADEIAATTPVDARAVAEDAVPGLRGASPVFLSVGRIERYKGFDDILSALERLAASGSLPPQWAWLVVGYGPGLAGLRRRAASLRQHVHLPGRVSEALLHALYERADAFVHASRFEGSSLVTLEAMAHRLPVVATRSGGIPDKVVHGVTGWLSDPGDVAALAHGIGEIARETTARARMGESGRERALASFSWPKIAQRTIAVYRELLEAERRR
jgi:glycogen synthase